MNTIRSTGYGWAVLCVAGAGAYYFAKKSINEDKAERQEKELKRRMLVQQLEARERVISRSKAAHSSQVNNISISGQEAGQYPAPTSHSPQPEKSKYAPKEPFVSKKGDRFS